MLLERDRELRQAGALVESAKAGRGALLLVEGTAGSGKTSVLAALRDHAREAGVRVLAARGGHVEQSFGYGVVRQLLEPVLEGASDEQRATLTSGAAEHALLVLGAAPEAGQEDQGGLRALHGLHWFTVNLTDEAPLLLVVDDAHWADVPSLQWLAYLLRRSEGLPVAIAVGARPEAADEVVAALDELADDALTTIARPRPLSSDAVRALVVEHLGAEPSARFVDAAAGVSGGNPFYLGELLRTARDEGIGPTDRDAPRLQALGPHRIARSVARRVAAVGSVAGDVAQALAVLEGASPAALVAELAGTGVREAIAAADALARTGVLEAGEPLDFAHPILRAAVADHIDPGVRADLHARAARALTGAGADPERVAAHLVRLPAGYPYADGDLAGTLLAAGRLALVRGTPGTAITLLERALEEPLEADLRADALATLARAELLAHRGGAVDHFREAMRTTPRVERRWQLALELSHQLIASGEDDVAVEVAMTTLAEPDLPEVVRLELEAEVAEAAAMDSSERMAEQRRRLDELVDRALGGEELHPMLAAAVAHRLVLSGRDVEAGSRIALAALSDPRLFAAGVSGAVGGATHAVVVSPRRGELRPLFDAMLGEAARTGSDRGLIWGSAMRAMVLAAEGDLRAAEDDVRTLITLLGGHEAPGTWAWLGANIAQVLCRRGLHEEADALLRERRLDDYAPRFPFAWLLLGEGTTARLCGRPEEGLERLRACGELVARNDPMPDALPWRSAAAECHLALGDAEAARALALDEVERARAARLPRAIGRAMTVAALAETGDAQRERLVEAVALLEGAAAPLELARATVELGAALRRAGQRVEARDVLRRGVDGASACGADALVARAREELVAAGARPQRDRLGGPEALTASERRVVDLAVEGRSNREIAQALFLTQKTVETHLSSAYRKLDISSRSQLGPALAA